MERKRNNHPLVNLFPTKWSAFLFATYIFLFVNQGILVTASKSGDKYAYNTIAAVLSTEVIKLIIAIAIYLKDEPISKLFSDIRTNFKIFLLYFVPAILYCLYNNLAYVNLASFDPTTYYILLQFRVVVTGVIYQFLFKRRLSAWQWFSLILLTTGCLVKNFGHTAQHSGPLSIEHVLNKNLLLILVQVFCSCFAGVYNEYLLKDSASVNVHIMIQNMFMYTDSIVCNLLVLMMSDSDEPNTQMSAFFSALLEPSVFMVILNNALCGIVTSLFLKNFNSILKTFAAALELVFTAVICFFLFSIAIDVYTVIAIAIVSYATYLYSKNPVTSRPQTTEHVKYNLADTTDESADDKRKPIQSV